MSQRIECEKMRRQPTAWYKIFADRVSDEGLVFGT